MDDLFDWKPTRERTQQRSRPLAVFDPVASAQLKDRGMTLAAENADAPLAVARRLAREIAQKGDGTCDADQVAVQMAARGVPPGPWCGSIFKNGEWQFTGQRRRSGQVSNHAREIRVWRLGARTY